MRPELDAGVVARQTVGMQPPNRRVLIACGTLLFIFLIQVILVRTYRPGLDRPKRHSEISSSVVPSDTGETSGNSQAVSDSPGEAEDHSDAPDAPGPRGTRHFGGPNPAKVKAAPLAPTLAAASQKFGVPLRLLSALMMVESGGAHRDGDHSPEGGYGVMNLRESSTADHLAQAAALIGKPKEDVVFDQTLNIDAAAALLARYHQEANTSATADSDRWRLAVARYSGRSNPDLANALADDTAAVMIRGFETTLEDGGGKVSLAPEPNPIFLPRNWHQVGLEPPAAKQDGGATSSPAESKETTSST